MEKLRNIGLKNVLIGVRLILIEFIAGSIVTMHVTLRTLERLLF